MNWADVRLLLVMSTLMACLATKVCCYTTGGCGGGCTIPVDGYPYCGSNCLQFEPQNNETIGQAYQNGAQFLNFCPLTQDSLELDNACTTICPLVSSPDKYIYYCSRTYNDGSNRVYSFIINQCQLGTKNGADPGCCFSDTVIGSVPGDGDCSYDSDSSTTTIYHRCWSCTGCPNNMEEFYPMSTVFGQTDTYQSMSWSSLQSAVLVAQAMGVPPQQYLALPMRLAPRCVTGCVCGQSTVFNTQY